MGWNVDVLWQQLGAFATLCFMAEEPETGTKRWFMSSEVVAPVMTGVLTGLVAFGASPRLEHVPAVLITAVLTGSLYYIFLRATKIKISPLEIEIGTVTHRINELQEKLEEDFFTKLVNINFRYIEKYYLQTQVQAEKSFRLASVAALIALVIIGVGISMMYVGKTTPAYVTTAAGVISEFIAAVFFYLYNRTILKMGQYHQKLVLTQNVSLAMKIAEGLPDTEKAKAQSQLVEALSKDVNQLLSRSDSEK